MYFAAKLPPASDQAQISIWGMLICARPALATRFGDFYMVAGLYSAGRRRRRAYPAGAACYVLGAACYVVGGPPLSPAGLLPHP